jgi:alcohol dehydrogenase
MRALLYKDFNDLPEVHEVRDPHAVNGGVVIRTKACGICRSDWYGWSGNDPDIVLPHVPGHELAGVVEEVGKDVSNWKRGDRVTVPFVGGCGKCLQCRSGNQQVCDRQFQPGFTAWGGFAEFVGIDYADVNLVRLPDEMDFVTAASLGCRFITAFRGLVDQAKVKQDEWVAVFGCGGVGLSAIMIAKAFRAKVVAIDIAEDKLAFAAKIGADVTMNSSGSVDIAEEIREATGGGVAISVDALGNASIIHDAMRCLSKRGRHIQIGLLETGKTEVPVPMDLIIAKELEILGSHGMQAHRYSEMFELIDSGYLKPELLIGKSVTLSESAEVLVNMDRFVSTGVTVINQF